MSENIVQFRRYPRSIRPALDPPGIYVRVAHTDHVVLSEMVASGEAACFGMVFDPTYLSSHGELRDQVLNRGLDAILDPKTQQSSLSGSYNDRIGKFPWGVGRPHTYSDFQDASVRRLVANLGDFALNNGFTQILAPTHVLRSVDDPWLPLDIDATRHLRNHLDKNGRGEVPIIYSLAIPYSLLRNAEQRQILIEMLKSVPAAAIWLRIENFGSSSRAPAVKIYIGAANEFHSLGKPVIADNVGGLAGLSLLAFGAVGGIVHGVTFGERFEASHWRKPRAGGGGPHYRVYFPSLDLMLKKAQATALLECSTRAKSRYGCVDTDCHPRGIMDMLERMGRHFRKRRFQAVSKLSQIPERLRPQEFLDDFVRPATYNALAASTINLHDESMVKKNCDQRKRLDSLLDVLGNQASNNPPNSLAVIPETRAAREARR